MGMIVGIAGLSVITVMVLDSMGMWPKEVEEEKPKRSAAKRKEKLADD